MGNATTEVSVSVSVNTGNLKGRKKSYAITTAKRNRRRLEHEKRNISSTRDRTAQTKIEQKNLSNLVRQFMALSLPSEASNSREEKYLAYLTDAQECIQDYYDADVTCRQHPYTAFVRWIEYDSPCQIEVALVIVYTTLFQNPGQYYRHNQLDSLVYWYYQNISGGQGILRSYSHRMYSHLFNGCWGFQPSERWGYNLGWSTKKSLKDLIREAKEAEVEELDLASIIGDDDDESDQVEDIGGSVSDPLSDVVKGLGLPRGVSDIPRVSPVEFGDAEYPTKLVAKYKNLSSMVETIEAILAWGQEMLPEVKAELTTGGTYIQSLAKMNVKAAVEFLSSNELEPDPVVIH